MGRDDRVVAATRRWLEEAVVALDLCPFAGRVVAAGRVRFRVSRARSTRTLLRDLAEELLHLAAADPASVETTLLVAPSALGDFLAFNDFLGLADALVAELSLAGEIQLASFHPQYRFQGSRRDDVANCTNRSPFPTLHLLREASVAGALAGFTDPSSIYRRNVRTMRRLGREGWHSLAERFGNAGGGQGRTPRGGKP